MGLNAPRGKYERLDVLVPAKVWRTVDKTDAPIATTCRNLSGRGCRLRIEDANLAPEFDLDSKIAFSLSLDPRKPELGGSAKIAWTKRERGNAGKVRLVLGAEFIGVSMEHREQIKAFIQSKAHSSGSPPVSGGPSLLGG